MSTTYSMTVSAIDLTYPLSYAGTVQAYDLGVDTAIETITGDHYTGPTEVTPTTEAQILETRGLFMDQHITIAPIPNNYGLITWDGNVLTVS